MRLSLQESQGFLCEIVSTAKRRRLGNSFQTVKSKIKSQCSARLIGDAKQGILGSRFSNDLLPHRNANSLCQGMLSGGRNITKPLSVPSSYISSCTIVHIGTSDYLRATVTISRYPTELKTQPNLEYHASVFLENQDRFHPKY